MFTLRLLTLLDLFRFMWMLMGMLVMLLMMSDIILNWHRRIVYMFHHPRFSRCLFSLMRNFSYRLMTDVLLGVMLMWINLLLLAIVGLLILLRIAVLRISVRLLVLLLLLVIAMTIQRSRRNVLIVLLLLLR